MNFWTVWAKPSAITDDLAQTVHKNSGRFWEKPSRTYYYFFCFFNIVIIIIIIIIICPAVKGSKLRSLPESRNIHRKSAPVTTIQPHQIAIVFLYFSSTPRETKPQPQPTTSLSAINQKI
jgi:hypothetical protein